MVVSRHGEYQKLVKKSPFFSSDFFFMCIVSAMGCLLLGAQTYNWTKFRESVLHAVVSAVAKFTYVVTIQ